MPATVVGGLDEGAHVRVGAGELEGEGRWSLRAEGERTVVRYDWQIRTTRWWMNGLAPAARPVFRWNHNVVMHQGGRGLADLLGARLLAVT